MVNRATPNLPSGDLAATRDFYARLCFDPTFENSEWMILTGHGVTLEFFPFPDLDPSTSSFGCCLRMDDVDAFVSQCQAAGIPTTTRGWPRVHPARVEASGQRIGSLVDPDCTLLRLVQND